jgi:hypothetical protein
MHRISRPSRAACLAVSMSLVASLLESPSGRADIGASPPIWPANVRLIPARLGVDPFVNFRLVLPQFRLYDSRGWRLASSSGYERSEFRSRLESFLAGEGTADGERRLSAELLRFETRGGRRLKEVPPADFTIIEYWAEWCQPCHVQSGELAEVLAGFPKLSVNVVYVYASPPGMAMRRARPAAD